MKIIDKNILRTALILLLVTGITVLMLAVVNKLTEGPIEELRKKELENTVSEMFEGCLYFEPECEDFPEGTSAFYVIVKDNKLEGYLVETKTQGFGGDMKMLVGLNPDKSIVGVKITEDAETSTKVAPVKNENHLCQYIGKIGPFVFSKSPKNDNEVSAVSSSTVSSTAVNSGVNVATNAVSAYEMWEKAKKGAN